MTVNVANSTAPPPDPSGNTAVFLGYDNTTAGNWKTVYGQDGNVIAQHSVLVPSYASFDTAGDINLFLLDLWATSPLALLKQFYSYSPSEHVESFFLTTTSMDFKIGANDGRQHRIALYACNYDGVDRQSAVTVLDGVTQTSLAVAGFSHSLGCAYAVFLYGGQVIFRVTPSLSGTGVLSAFFWGGSSAPPGPLSDASTPPTVNLYSPAAGSTVSGTVYLTALAGSRVGIANVRFQVDGNTVGIVPVFPYSLPWDSTTVPNGAHTLTAIMTDSSGVGATMSIAVNASN